MRPEAQQRQPDKPIRLPHAPFEIGLLILRAALFNPIELLALMTREEKAGVCSKATRSGVCTQGTPSSKKLLNHTMKPTLLLNPANQNGNVSFLHQAALENEFWVAYTPPALLNRKDTYALTFLERYNKMTDKERCVLERLWKSKEPSPKEILRDSICFQNNFDIVLAAVSRNGMALQYASSHLRKDNVIVLAALKQNSGAFTYIDSELKSDRIILAAAHRDKSSCIVSGQDAGFHASDLSIDFIEEHSDRRGNHYDRTFHVCSRMCENLLLQECPKWLDYQEVFDLPFYS